MNEAQLLDLAKRAPSPSARKALLRKARQKAQGNQADELRIQIIKCRNCGLNRTRNNAVPYSGPTHGKADLMLVGEAPGADEDAKGVPFVGKSGKLLDRLLRVAGTDRDRCFVANTLACRPPNNRDPKARELEACRPNFDAQIELADVPVGVTLGAYALANVIGKARSSVSMGEYLDKPVWVDGRIWIPPTTRPTR
jgi:uracil-DNA glycosylase